MRTFSAIIMALVFMMGCTQIMEDEETSENAYQGSDGCIYCHTSESRLKALAPEEEEGGGEGGGAVG